MTLQRGVFFYCDGLYNSPMYSALYNPRIMAVLWVVLFSVVLGYIFGTSPDRVGPAGVTLFFIFLYLLTAVSLQLGALVYLGFRGRPLTADWRTRYSLIFALLPVTVISLGSLDQLVLRDIIIFVGLLVVTAFYLGRQAPKQK